MKKLLILCVLSIFTFSSFTEYKKPSEIVTVRTWKVYCSGQLTGIITCDCNQAQATSMAYIMCYGNP